MSIGENLILWAAIIWLPWLMYALLRNEAKPKKNIIVGVTLPYAAQTDPEVKSLLEKYQKELKLTAWLMTAAAVPCLFVHSFGVSMTLWLTWIVAACFVLNIPYVRCNRALARLKEERCWKKPAGRRTVADLEAAAAELRWLSPLWFLPPFLACFVPLLFEREFWWLWLLNAALEALFYLCYRFLYRNRSEVVDGDTDRTLALTRIRRYNWGKAWLICAWATGAFGLGMWLTLEHIWLFMAVTLAYALAITVALLGIEFRVRRLQEKLTAGGGQGDYVDEDDRWIWGMFYYNPDDRHMMVNARVGINTTFNLARRPAQVIVGLILVLLLACPLCGIWMVGMEKAPVELAVTGTEITASHYHTEYRVALEDVENAELLTELPPIRRVSGTAMETAKTGTWFSDAWGRFTCCIDPREGPWLLLEMEGGARYLFGGGEDGAAEEVIVALTKQ